MREFPRQPIRLRITAGACVIFALMLLVLPLQWLIAAMLAAAVHELFHVLVVVLCGGRIDNVLLSSSGASMDAQHLSLPRELIATLAGPVGSLCTVFLFRWLPRTSVCAVFHLLWNLLPIDPLDGGHALRCVAQILFHRNADKFCRIVENVFLIGITVLATVAAVWYDLGLIPILMAAMLWLKRKKLLENHCV